MIIVGWQRYRGLDHQGGHERQMAFVGLSNLSRLRRAWLTAIVAALLCLAATALAVAETKSLKGVALIIGQSNYLH
ncbi:hypothetical protein, partial [Mesorhizobium sp. M7A.F.Ca.CA.004.04.2.1]|uniref:hypothetical protein n=1 Tax=Mesorhizobium sp. M7A.F.Ca.CA.004.04.2.1 TaxID=2496677 RepID=UPI000FD2BF02